MKKQMVSKKRQKRFVVVVHYTSPLKSAYTADIDIDSAFSIVWCFLLLLFAGRLADSSLHMFEPAQLSTAVVGFRLTLF
jgi:hypothetical protein